MLNFSIQSLREWDRKLPSRGRLEPGTEAKSKDQFRCVPKHVLKHGEAGAGDGSEADEPITLWPSPGSASREVGAGDEGEELINLWA